MSASSTSSSFSTTVTPITVILNILNDYDQDVNTLKFLEQTCSSPGEEQHAFTCIIHGSPFASAFTLIHSHSWWLILSLVNGPTGNPEIISFIETDVRFQKSMGRSKSMADARLSHEEAKDVPSAVLTSSTSLPVSFSDSAMSLNYSDLSPEVTPNDLGAKPDRDFYEEMSALLSCASSADDGDDSGSPFCASPVTEISHPKLMDMMLPPEEEEGMSEGIVSENSVSIAGGRAVKKRDSVTPTSSQLKEKLQCQNELRPMASDTERISSDPQSISGREDTVSLSSAAANCSP